MRSPSPATPFELVVFGGSQGARFFSEVLPPALAAAAAGRARAPQRRAAGRAEDVDAVVAAYREAAFAPRWRPSSAICRSGSPAAHLVIGRSGASTVAELTVIGRPSILVPLPHALDNDQLQNAQRLAESGAAWCIEQKQISPARLAGDIGVLLGDPDGLAAAAAAAKRLGRPDAVGRLADLVEG